MHLVKLDEPCFRPGDGTTLAPGIYVVENLTAFELGYAAERGTVSIRPFEWSHEVAAKTTACIGRFQKGRMLIVHPGGYGDLIMLGPALRRLKFLHPNIEIYVACRARARVVFDGLGYPDGFVDYPLRHEVLAEYEHVRFLENLNECGEIGRTIHAVDAKAMRIGIRFSDDPRDKMPEFRIPDHAAEITKKFPRLFRPDKQRMPRIGIQLSASVPNRTYLPAHLSQIMAERFVAQWEIMIFGSPGTTGPTFVPQQFRGQVTDLCEARLTFQESAAMIRACDIMLVPDSGLMHVAGALGVPTVALFGPIDWRLRSAYYPSVTAMQGKEGCPIAPCFFHPRGGIFFPRGQDCERTRKCTALDSIDPLKVIAKIEKVYAAAQQGS